MPLEQCPKCNYRLGSPLKSSGRQVCAKCGWTDQPRQKFADQPAQTQPAATQPDMTKPATAKPATAKPATSMSPHDIQKILEQAAAQALNNMKPKGKQDPNLPTE